MTLEMRGFIFRRLQAKGVQQRWVGARFGSRSARRACTVAMVRRFHAMGARTL